MAYDEQIKLPKHLQELIEQREGLQLDFKFEVSDLSKIARSIVAFANTKGGILLIGVKDNGKIAGVQSEEELYMIQAAARMYCRPSVDFYFRSWQVKKKTVLEVIIPESKHKPHYAKDSQGRWKAYVRVNDKNFLVNNVQLRVWRSQFKSRQSVNIRFDRKEDVLLRYLRSHDFITFRKFCQLAKIPPKVAEDVLVDLILIDVLKINYSDTGVVRYSLQDDTLSESSLSD